MANILPKLSDTSKPIPSKGYLVGEHIGMTMPRYSRFVSDHIRQQIPTCPLQEDPLAFFVHFHVRLTYLHSFLVKNGMNDALYLAKSQLQDEFWPKIRRGPPGFPQPGAPCERTDIRAGRGNLTSEVRAFLARRRKGWSCQG